MKEEHSSAALLLKMGAGKTKIWIDLINNKGWDTTLIVCPYKATRVWLKQFPIHSVNRDISVYNLAELSSKEKVEAMRKDAKTRQNGSKIVYIINYDSIWREPFRSYVKSKVKFDAIICDESHRLKSPSSKVSKFMQVLGKRCEHRYIATGTLLAQTPLDVYAQYRFMNPEVFGTNYKDFCGRYTNVDINRTMRLGYTVLDEKEPYVNLNDLRERIMSCAFSVDAELDLPPTRDITVEFDLSPKISRLYKEIQKEGAVELENGTMEINNVLSMVLRLQQLASGFIQLEDEYGNRRIEVLDDSRCKALEDLLLDLPIEEPVVIFARFKQDIRNIRRVCKETGRKCSEISGRCDEYDDWDQGKTSVLIVQIESGAEGLDFTRAKYAVYYTLTHKLWQYTQSRKRLHRPGQKNEVTYYILQGKLKRGKSVDEKMLESLNRNENFIQRVIADKSV
jgi:SNF2 family DNA or RNA helicase